MECGAGRLAIRNASLRRRIPYQGRDSSRPRPSGRNPGPYRGISANFISRRLAIHHARRRQAAVLVHYVLVSIALRLVDAPDSTL